MKTIGVIRLGVGTNEERVVQLTDIVLCRFKDDKVCSVAKCEEGNYFLQIENPPDSGKAPEAKIYLSEGSLYALLFTVHSLLFQENADYEEKFKEYCITEDSTQFDYFSGDK